MNGIETPALRGIGTIDQAFVGLYLVVVILIGVYYARRQKTQEDFLLGGRRVNPIASGISIIVTLLSLISYLALVGETAKYGPVYALGVLISLPFIYFTIAFFLIPALHEAPHHERLRNPGEAARDRGPVGGLGHLHADADRLDGPARLSLGQDARAS